MFYIILMCILHIVFHRKMSTPKSPYVTESAKFFDSLSYSRLVQTTDHRYTFEFPIRRDFIPGHVWKRCYSDGTWTVVVEMAHKYKPRNVYIDDFVARANQHTVFSTAEDFRKFNTQFEGTEPITLSEIATPKYDKVHLPDHLIQPVPRRSRSTGYTGRQWRDMETPPPIPSWQRDHIRVPAPQRELPTRLMESSPYHRQVESQTGNYREANATDMPDLTAQPSSLNEHLAQQDYLKRRKLAAAGSTSSFVPSLMPVSTTATAGTTRGLTSAEPTTAVPSTPMITGPSTSTYRPHVRERLGPHEATDEPAQMGTRDPPDPPLSHSRPYQLKHDLTERQVVGLTDGQLKRQYNALKRKYQRALAERRYNLAQFIDQQVQWYLGEQQRRQTGRYRLPKACQTSSSTTPTITVEPIKPRTGVVRPIASVPPAPITTIAISDDEMDNDIIPDDPMTATTSNVMDTTPPRSLVTSTLASTLLSSTPLATTSLASTSLATIPLALTSLATTSLATNSLAITPPAYTPAVLTTGAILTYTSTTALSARTTTVLASQTSTPSTSHSSSHLPPSAPTVDTTDMESAATTTIAAVTNAPSNQVTVGSSMASDIVSAFNVKTLPPLLAPPRPPRKRKGDLPPLLPCRQETSAEKIYRMFLVEPETDVANSSYWLEDKTYMWGGLSDWSEVDSEETQERYRRRHVRGKERHPIITRLEYRNKKRLALERGYYGTISNSPYKHRTFCLHGKPEPPHWWKQARKDELLRNYEDNKSSIATGENHATN